MCLDVGVGVGSEGCLGIREGEQTWKAEQMSWLLEDQSHFTENRTKIKILVSV